MNLSKKCNKPSEVDELDKSGYRAILKNSWQDQCFAHMTDGKLKKYSDEQLLSVIAKVSSVSELAEKYPLEYRAAYKRHEWKQWARHLSRQRKLHTDDEIFKVAKKYKSRLEFFRKSGDEYRAAKRRGIFEQAVAHMPTRKRRI